VGWCDLHFYASTRGGVGVGDDKHSWGYDGYRILFWHNGKRAYGKRWKAGDVIGCAADLDTRAVRFFHNGTPMGAACENMEFVGGLAPGITLNPCALTVNFGTAPFKHGPPPGHLPIQRWLELYDPNPARQTKTSAAKNLLVGLSAKGLAIPELNRTVSRMTRPQSELKKLPLRASSGYTQALISGHKVSATSHYPSIVGDRILLTEGKWYYEVKVLSLEGRDGNAVAFVGWCDGFFFGSSIVHQGIGDDAHSWGWGTKSGRQAPPQLKHNGKARPWLGAESKVRNWNPKDVIGCAVDLDEKTIQFSLNGVWGPNAVAFKGFDVQRGLLPGVSVNSQCELEINFGKDKFKHTLPEGYIGVSTWFEQNKALTSIQKQSALKSVQAQQIPTTVTEEGSNSAGLLDMKAANEQLASLKQALATMQMQVVKASSNVKTLLDTMRHLEALGGAFGELQQALQAAENRVSSVLKGEEKRPSPEKIQIVLNSTKELIHNIGACFETESK